MASNINVTIPPLGSPTTAGVRANFSAAKSEIEVLQTARTIRVQHVSDAVEVFQQISVSDTQQVIDFNSTLFNNGGIYTFDDTLNELTFIEAGYYEVLVNFQFIRKVAGTSCEFAIHAELKPPSSGVFIDFPGSARIVTLDGSVANQKDWRAYTVIARIPESGYKLRWLQSTTDATKQVGIISHPSTASVPSTAGIVISINKIGEEL